MITKITPDFQKSNALKQMAEITLKRLNSTNLEEYPSNTLLDYYDILHQLLEAIAFKEGFKTKGEGAHQELINQIAKQGILNESSRNFLQKMRDYRNRISYQGLMINKNYLDNNKLAIEKLISELFQFLNKH